ncbi:hypothetical protein C8J56DRAFT_316063 [Mycena floridula]|nr:hypothetical protein C8J56DRAFT_316063 [Mycena floridula]
MVTTSLWFDYRVQPTGFIFAIIVFNVSETIQLFPWPISLNSTRSLIYHGPTSNHLPLNYRLIYAAVKNPATIPVSFTRLSPFNDLTGRNLENRLTSTLLIGFFLACFTLSSPSSAFSQLPTCHSSSAIKVGWLAEKSAFGSGSSRLRTGNRIPPCAEFLWTDAPSGPLHFPRG